MFLYRLTIIGLVLLVSSCDHNKKYKTPDIIKNRDTLSSRIYYKKNVRYLSENKYDSLVYNDSVLLRTNEVVKDLKTLGNQNYLMGYYYDEIEQISDSAFYRYNKSKGYFEQLSDTNWIGKNLLNMALIQKNQNDFFGSKETLTEALKYLQVEDDQKFIASSYNVLATNHRKLLNYKDAIKYYNKAIASVISKKDKLIYQNNLAATYIDSKDYVNAILTLNSLLKDSLFSNNKKEHARILDNLTYAKWLTNDAVAEKELRKPLKIRQQINDKRGQIASYTHLGEYNSIINPKRAKTYFDSVIQLSKRLKIPRAEKDVLKQLMSLEPKNVKIRNRYVFLQDSLYAQGLKVKTQFAKYKYDDKLKQESILRLEKEKAEQELEVVQQRNLKLRSYTIGSLLVLISSFATYFFIQRSKKLKQQNKTAKLEATYETEAELSRKLHDDFGGKLNHVMLLLQSEANNEEVLNIVDGLYNQSRDFSREINDVDTGPNFKNFLFGMMGNYCKNTKLVASGSTDIDWSKISTLSKKTLFKVLQELMINMQKHSNASLVSIAFQQSKKRLKVTYFDNGVGASKEELHLKNGLWNTEKRIKAIGGTIIFDSEKETGFEAQIEIPN